MIRERLSGDFERKENEDQELDPNLIMKADETWKEMSVSDKEELIMNILNTAPGPIVAFSAKYSIKQLVEEKKLKSEALRALVNELQK